MTGRLFYYCIIMTFNIVFALSCGGLKKTESITTTTTTVSNATVNGKWLGGSMPISVRVSTSYSGAENTLLTSMGDQWESGTGNAVNFFSFGAQVANKSFTDLNDYYDSEYGIYQNNNWPTSVSSFALAITQYFGFRRNVGQASEYIELTHADIIINEDYFNFSTNSAAGTYDLPTVVLHELGHFVGLNHTSTTPAVMAPTLASQTQVRSLYTHDITSVKSNYGLAALMPVEEGVDAGPYSISFIKSEMENQEKSYEGEFVNGMIELKYDGTCNHYVKSTVVDSHKYMLRKLKGMATKSFNDLFSVFTRHLQGP